MKMKLENPNFRGKMNVYVVLGEQGEYSERSVWVSGVFTSEEGAKNHIVERMAVSRVTSDWQRRYWSEVYRLQDKFRKEFGDQAYKVPDVSKNIHAQAILVHPRPEDIEASKACSLFIVTLNEWISEETRPVEETR